jgi:hypothetical protein
MRDPPPWSSDRAALRDRCRQGGGRITSFCETAFLATAAIEAPLRDVIGYILGFPLRA